MAFPRRDGRRPAWVAVLVALCVASGLTWPGTAAAGAACPTADGVTVVIDYGRLGGGVQVGCATGLTAASRGSAALQGAGFTWSPPNNFPGFVCRIDGRPTIDETVGSGNDPGYTESCVTTPPADASWSYWQSSGDGNWSYSNNGITSSRVRPGGFEGWVFGRGDASPPGYQPVTPTPAPAPEPAPATEPVPTTTTPASTTISRPSTPAPSSSASSTRTGTTATGTTTTATTSTSTTPSTPAPETETPSTVADSTTTDPTHDPTAASSDPATPSSTPTATPSTDATAATTADGSPTGAAEPAAADESDPDSAALTVLAVAALITALIVGTVLIHRHRSARDDD